MNTRLKKYISLSRSYPYTEEELKLLYSLINGKLNNDHPSELYNNFLEIMFSLEDEIKGEGILTDLSDDDVGLYFLNFLQYLLIYFKRVFLFLICVPVKKVPMYIGDEQLDIFVQWRLQINK